MALTYYDMEKLMRMAYDQKLSASVNKIGIGRRKTRDRVPPRERVLCRIRPSGSAAQWNRVLLSRRVTWTRNG